MRNIIYSIYFYITSISISGIEKLSIYNPYNLSGFFLLIIFFFLKEKKIKKEYIFYIFFLVANLIFNFEKQGLLLLVSLSPILYKSFLKKNIKYLRKYVNIQLIILMTIFIIDFIYRFKGNYNLILLSLKSFLLNNRTIINFYTYKVNSIMYADTNYTAIIIGITFLYYLHLEKYKIVRIKYYKWLCIFLLIFTFSRAAIISIIISLFYKKYNGLLKKYKLIVGTGMIIMFISILPKIIDKLKEDNSISTRFELINLFFNKVTDLNIMEILLGVGFTNSNFILGEYGHNFIVVMTLEGGILFFLLLVWIFILMWIEYKKFREILIYFILCIMSVTQYNYIFIFVILTTLKAIEEVKNDKCNNGNL